ncbi:MAG: beta-ketoacyl synthase N-terminal-like domain-containing protein, partial [Pseudomonadota bacterium]
MNETVKTPENNENRYAELVAKAAEKIASMRIEIENLKQHDHEPIAIIGMGCRFPLADNPEKYWELLANGVDAMQDAPEHHAYLNAFYDPNPEALGKIYTRRAGFLQQPP